MPPITLDESTFVGRESELAALAARFEGARAGRGSVALLAGEPGIGKTRVVRAFADYARERGALVLWGRSYEGDWSPPYAPWVEAIGGFVRAADPLLVRGALGQSLLERPGLAAQVGTSLAELVPDLAPLVADLPSLVSLGPNEERYRLYDAVVRFLLRLAAKQTVVVVLDDIHWADRASLELLRHLGHFVGQGAVLVVATYRDLELDGKHPLTQLLPVLRRDADAAPIALRGLPIVDVDRLIGGNDGLANAIHQETNGNPFFIHELVRHLADEGALVPNGRGWVVHGDLADLGIPEGVRQVVARRLARLSSDAERLLSHAAVFTGGFDFAVLPALTGIPEDALLDAVDETLAARLIQPVEPGPERYDFVHAIVRNVLADSWSPSRRVRIHRRAAEALLRAYPGRECEHAAELAVQYHRSLSLPGEDAGISYALYAADAARRAHSPDQIVTFLRIARDLAANTNAAIRAANLTRLAVAEAEAVLIDEARRTIDEASQVLDECRADSATLAEFLATVANALKWRASADSRVWRPLVERGLSLCGDRHDRTWARLMLQVDPVEPVSRETIRAGRWLGYDPEAIAVLRATGDEEDFARTVESFDHRTRAETDAYVTRARGWSNPTAIMQALTAAANDYHYQHGAFRDAANLWRELIALGERYGALSWQAQAWNQITWLHVAAGRFAEARASEARANDLLTRLGPGRKPESLAMEMATSFAMYLGGDWPTIAAYWTRFVDDPTMGPNDISTLAGALYGALAAYAHTEAGTTDESRRLLDVLTPVLTASEPIDCNLNGAVAHAATAIWRLRADDLATQYRRLALKLIEAERGDYPQCSNALSVARMAALLGQIDEAREYFDRARRTLHAAEQDPLLATVDFDEAIALLHADESASRAAELFDSAIAGFESMDMPIWADRAREGQNTLATRPAGRAALPAGLTEREVDVLRLVARGQSDRQISEELYISPRTVNAHLRNMLTKTDSANRTELSIWAFAHGLVTRGDA
ncbi:MAG: helix-turn-helix transcriptional regulator [Thermomicrobiales bacterium]